jgi:hypothetical protein
MQYAEHLSRTLPGWNDDEILRLADDLNRLGETLARDTNNGVSE